LQVKNSRQKWTRSRSAGSLVEHRSAAKLVLGTGPAARALARQLMGEGTAGKRPPRRSCAGKSTVVVTLKRKPGGYRGELNTANLFFE